MKKILPTLLIGIFMVLSLAGCGRNAEPSADGGKIDIVCSTFPQYDWVQNLILGNEDRFSLTLLMEKGGDLHNFQPTALDIARVSDCDLFIYVGGESDAWVDDALKEAVNSDMHVVNMMELISSDLKEEEHDHDHHHEEDHAHDEVEYDEHVWLSLRNAKSLVEGICEVLAEIDGANANIYRRNCDEYVNTLEVLDSEYTAAVGSASGNTLLFADRFPFRYLVEDYGLEYFAAFEGCSAETEASFEIVAFLAGKLDELGLGAVLVIDGSDERLAQVIIENTSMKNQEILVINSMQSVSKKDVENGVTYLSVMKDNLEILRRALE